jgi:GTPase SAR1 family protein
MPIYGQIVVGPPGSGKTTYCDGMQQYLRLVGRTDTLVVNLDPANESAATTTTTTTAESASASDNDDCKHNPEDEEKWGDETDVAEDEGSGGNDQEVHVALPYDTLLDVCEEVVNLSSVMDECGLGPNGGLMYCMEYLEHHLDHVVELVKSRIQPTTYLLLDLPGQVELYTHCTCVQNILGRLAKDLDLRLCMVNLIDAHYCADASKFISAALLSTTAMLRLELPAVNVLSKIDMISQYGELPYNLDYFTECHELERLVPFLDGVGGIAGGGEGGDDDFDVPLWYDDPEYVKARAKTRRSRFFQKRKRMHELLSEVVDDYGLLHYIPLDITDAASVGRVVAQVDRANGYVFISSSIGGGGQDGKTSAYSKEGKEFSPPPDQPNEVTNMFQCAIQAEGAGWEYEQLANVQEKFMGMFKESISELQEGRRG